MRFARAACRSRWRTAWLSVFSAALLAGCGASEREAIPAPTAEALAAQSDRVAEALEGGDPCEADRLADELVADAEAAPLPEEHRARLLASARSLAAMIECPEPPPVEEDEDDDDDEGNGKGKGKGKKGKG